MKEKLTLQQVLADIAKRYQIPEEAAMQLVREILKILDKGKNSDGKK